MPGRVADERVSAEEDHVRGQDQRADADAESGEPHRLPDVVGEDREKGDGEVEEEAVRVLQYERHRALAAVGLSRLAHRTGGRVGPERFVVRAPAVVAGQPEPTRRPEDENGKRDREPGGKPRGRRTEAGMLRMSEQLRRVEGGAIWSGRVVPAL